MTTANLHEVKSRLAHYARLVKAGKTALLCERNKPFAEIRPLLGVGSPPPKRKLGLMKGWSPVPDNFNKPNIELEDVVENTPSFPAIKTPPYHDHTARYLRFPLVSRRKHRLSTRVRSILEDSPNTLRLHQASPWEIQIKYSLGKLPLPYQDISAKKDFLKIAPLIINDLQYENNPILGFLRSYLPTAYRRSGSHQAPQAQLPHPRR